MSVIYRAFTGLAAGAVAISAANAAAIDLAAFAGAGGDLSPEPRCPCVCPRDPAASLEQLSESDEPVVVDAEHIDRVLIEH